MTDQDARDLIARLQSWADPDKSRMVQDTDELALQAADALDRLLRELADVKEEADSVLFHQLCCLGDCHESMASMARLAKLTGFEADPATNEEIEAALKAPADHGKTHQCFCEERESALARERASLRAQTWQPIETAPKDGTPIIGRLPLDGQIVSVRYWTPEKIAAEEGGHPDEYCGGWYSTSDSSDEYLPKHWIPSPPSPSTIEGEEGR